MADGLHLCHICRSQSSLGIWLVEGFICSKCLEEISCTDVRDPKYGYFVAKLRELWQTG